MGYTNARAECVEEPPPLTKHAGGGLVTVGNQKGAWIRDLRLFRTLSNSQHFCSQPDTQWWQSDDGFTLNETTYLVVVVLETTGTEPVAE